jgi:hypothetical protein
MRCLVSLLAGSLLLAQTTQDDHRRMLELLKIEKLRAGADGRNPEAPNAANYDESRANPYPELPDPLRFANGKRVKNVKDWAKRAAEIREDFDREVYGRTPKVTPPVRWEVLNETEEQSGAVPVRVRKLAGHVDNSGFPAVKVDIDMTLWIPAQATGKLPVVLEYGFVFPGRPNPQPVGRQLTLEKGWAYAFLVPVSVQADNGAGLTKGIIGLVNRGQPRTPDDWGALKAWAWGGSRALDYFASDPQLDASRVAIEGHSRYGKAAVVTMAYDPRFSLAFLSSSGAGGVKLHRRDYGERVENVAAANEYHWMAGNYMKYAGPLTPKDLPVDAHELLALCAPRPVFISAGDKGDAWVDPKGAFLAGVGAGPVYRLFGKRDLGTAEYPPLETGLMDGEIAFRQHSGGHTPGPNWPHFLSFAERYWKR